MATAKWSTPGTPSANLAGTALDGLASGSTSAFLTVYDNSTALDLYAGVVITLGSITPTTGGTITLRLFSSVNGVVPDNTASLGGGEAYTMTLTVSTGIKTLTLPMVRIYPNKIYFTLTNASGVSLATSGNSVILVPFDEAAN